MATCSELTKAAKQRELQELRWVTRAPVFCPYYNHYVEDETVCGVAFNLLFKNRSSILSPELKKLRFLVDRNKSKFTVTIPNIPEGANFEGWGAASQDRKAKILMNFMTHYFPSFLWMAHTEDQGSSAVVEGRCSLCTLCKGTIRPTSYSSDDSSSPSPKRKFINKRRSFMSCA